jgi:hypothetical protein
MTPKQKAAYLVVKYMSKIVDMKLSKECALVAIDEMINITPWCGDENVDIENGSKEFYMNVKQEIEKI